MDTVVEWKMHGFWSLRDMGLILYVPGNALDLVCKRQMLPTSQATSEGPGLTRDRHLELLSPFAVGNQGRQGSQWSPPRGCRYSGI